MFYLLFTPSKSKQNNPTGNPNLQVQKELLKNIEKDEQERILEHELDEHGITLPPDKNRQH